MSEKPEEGLRSVDEAAMDSTPNPNEELERGNVWDHVDRRHGGHVAAQKARVTAQFDADVVE